MTNFTTNQIRARIQPDQVVHHKVQLMKANYPGRAGERVYSCVPPFRITTLSNWVVSNPFVGLVPSMMWTPNEEDKYAKECFPKLVSEGKLVEIGTLNSKQQIELSKAGKEHLEKMQILYNL